MGTFSLRAIRRFSRRRSKAICPSTAIPSSSPKTSSTTPESGAEPSGLLAYHAGAATLLSRLVWMDRKGGVIGTVAEKDAFWAVDLSPNQQKVLVPIGDPQREIWIEDLERKTRTKVTIPGAYMNTAIWSPDGSTIYVDVLRRGVVELIARRLTGGETVLDRRKTFYTPRAVSPNGKWLAYGSNEIGHNEVFVISLANPESKWQVSTNGGNYPRWRGDGKEIFFVDLTSHINAASVTETATSMEFGTPESLFAVSLRPAARAYDVSADGQKFLVNVVADQESPTVMLLNDWKTRLPR